MRGIFRAFFAGLLALLPTLLTIYGLYLLVDFVVNHVNSGSEVGQILIALGRTVGFEVQDDSPVHWIVGFVIVVLAVTVFGVIVQSRIGPWLLGLFERPILSIPVVGSIFDMMKRMTAIMDTTKGGDLKNMSPVWCFFGGDKKGAAVFALLPTQERVTLGDAEYLGIMIPTAPVPIGGALLYVPAGWIEPADGAVDHFMSVYVSMGVQPPNGAKPAAETPPTPSPSPEV